MTISQIQNALAPVFSQYGVRKAVLFGSHAKGCARDQSDVDLMVDSGLKGFAFFGLLEDIFVALGNSKPIDVLDTAQIAKESKIDNEIRKTGVTIYEQSNPVEFDGVEKKAESLESVSVGQRPTKRGEDLKPCKGVIRRVKTFLMSPLQGFNFLRVYVGRCPTLTDCAPSGLTDCAPSGLTDCASSRLRIFV